MNQNQDAVAVAAAALLGVICLLLIVAIVVAIFYLLTLQKALSRVSPRNRLMEPGMVWPSPIPLFNIIWSFYIATRDSLKNEFRDRGQDDGSDYCKRIGLTNAILGVASIPLSLMRNVFDAAKQREFATMLGLIEIVLWLVSLVLFIIFWVRIAGYSRELAALPSYSDGGPDYDGGDDDRDRGASDPSSDAIRPADPGAFGPDNPDRY